jgi:hypothetical protein
MDMTHHKSSKRLSAVVVIPVLAIAAFVAAASVMRAVSQDSWAPIWSIGWLPAVLVASLWGPASREPCWPRLRSLTRR